MASNFKTKHAVYANGQLIGQVDQAGGWLDAVQGLTGYRNSDTGGSSVTVITGDTLSSIAQRVYGNATLWYVIASANALAPDSKLVAGTTLKAPEVTTTKNDATTFKPYDPSQITGNSVNYAYIPPPPQVNCIKVAIMVIIIVIVTIYTAGAAAGALGVTGTTTTAATATAAASTTAAGAGALGASALAGTAVSGVTLGTAAVGSFAAATSVGTALAVSAGIGAFVGSIAGQLVGKAMGVVDHFSLRSAVGSGITSALTAGIGGQWGSVGQALNDTNYAKAAALAVGYATTSYVGNRIAGVADTHFSWKSIAANAVTSLAVAGIDKMAHWDAAKAFGGSGMLTHDIANGLMGSVIGHEARNAFGVDDRFNLAQAAGDAFGNAIGNGLVRQWNGTGNFLGIVEKPKAAISAEQQASLAKFGTEDQLWQKLQERASANGSAVDVAQLRDNGASFDDVAAQVFLSNKEDAPDGPFYATGGRLGISSSTDNSRFGLKGPLRDEYADEAVSHESYLPDMGRYMKNLSPLAGLEMYAGQQWGVLKSLGSDVESLAGAATWVAEAVYDQHVLMMGLAAGVNRDTPIVGEAFGRSVDRTVERIQAVSTVFSQLPEIIEQLPGQIAAGFVDKYKAALGRMEAGHFFDAGVAMGQLGYEAVGVILAVVGGVGAVRSLARTGFVGMRDAVASWRAMPASEKALASERFSARVANEFETTDSIAISGKNATQRAASYEDGVRKLYDEVPLSRRTYAAPHNPSGIGRADSVAEIEGRELAIEAKYTDDWAKSPFNPDSDLPWAASERARMVTQAKNYSEVFDGIIYHTNSVDLASYYSRTLLQNGVTNFRFVITPATR